jgi:hypothetical protein
MSNRLQGHQRPCRRLNMMIALLPRAVLLWLRHSSTLHTMHVSCPPSVPPLSHDLCAPGAVQARVPVPTAGGAPGAAGRSLHREWGKGRPPASRSNMHCAATIILASYAAELAAAAADGLVAGRPPNTSTRDSWPGMCLHVAPPQPKSPTPAPPVVLLLLHGPPQLLQRMLSIWTDHSAHHRLSRLDIIIVVLVLFEVVLAAAEMVGFIMRHRGWQWHGPTLSRLIEMLFGRIFNWAHFGR